MKQKTVFITFLAAALCLLVSLNIEAEFYARFLSSILGEGRFGWLPLLSAITVQVARLATSWNSATFAARGMKQQANSNLGISGTIATYETVEICLFGVAYLDGGTAAAFVLFGCFFVWVSFALEIILTRALQPRTDPAPVSEHQTAAVAKEIEALKQRLDSIGSYRPDRRKKNGAARETAEKRGNWEPLVMAEYERRVATGESVAYQAIATAVGCNKTTAFRILQPLRNN